ncbi:hypothetical protein [Sphingomonas sp.]|uniref:hypothetical protein n=1 Tax=Sphingomonas sp. TaxID=28214 RepID=UPI003D6D8E17
MSEPYFKVPLSVADKIGQMLMRDPAVQVYLGMNHLTPVTDPAPAPDGAAADAPPPPASPGSAENGDRG